jgi:uncharacterized protein YjlB
LKTFHFEDDANTPNHPEWPLVVYEAAFEPSEVSAGTIENTFHDHQWTGTWRNGIFSYHHYHSNAHEVLGVASGKATVQFGGEEGEVMDLQAGDVAVLPAGCGHKNLRSQSLLVVGGYPSGQTNYDLIRSKSERPLDVLERIRSVPPPSADPVHGSEGPLMEVWD